MRGHGLDLQMINMGMDKATVEGTLTEKYRRYLTTARTLHEDYLHEGWPDGWMQG